MHNTLQMGYKDVLQYLQDIYHMESDGESLRQHSTYMKRKSSPRYDGCFRLFHAFLHYNRDTWNTGSSSLEPVQTACTLWNGCWRTG